MSVDRYVVLLVCIASCGVVFRYRNATSGRARLVAATLGGFCLALLAATGLFDPTAPVVATLKQGDIAGLGLAGYLLYVRARYAIPLACSIVTATLMSSLPALRVPLAIAACFGMIAWLYLNARRSRHPN